VDWLIGVQEVEAVRISRQSAREGDKDGRHKKLDEERLMVKI
jgi:hypothetical protein